MVDFEGFFVSNFLQQRDQIYTTFGLKVDFVQEFDFQRKSIAFQVRAGPERGGIIWKRRDPRFPPTVVSV